VNRDELFDAHHHLAVSLARRFARRTRSGESVDDLIQVALLGLIGAIDRYDPTLGVPLSSFAAATIIGSLKRHVRDRSWSVRPPRRVQELYLQTNQASAELSQELGRLPTASEIAERVGHPVELIAEALHAGRLRTWESLDQPSGPDGAGLGQDAGTEGIDERLSVARLLTHLPERQRRIVRLHYLDGLTQHQIADQLQLSQAHVQRLLARSVARLRVLAAAS
jgi:RNA polymerase sigma-B factor